MQIKITAWLTAVMMVAAMGWAVAAEKNAANIARMYHFTAKPGMQDQLYKALKTHAEFRRKAGDPWNWNMYTIVNGNDLGSYTVRSGGHKWSDLDRYEVASRTLGLSADFNRNVAPLLEQHKTSSWLSADEEKRSIWPDSVKFTLVSVRRYSLSPGKRKQYTDAVDRVVKALKKHKYSGNFSFSSNINGGRGDSVVLAIPLTKWADFDGPDVFKIVAKEYGDKKATKIFHDYATSFTGSESWVVRQLPELSVIH